MEDAMALATMDPEFERALSQHTGPLPTFSGDIATIRAGFVGSDHKYPDPLPADDVEISNLKVPARDGYEIPIRVYSPKQSTEGGSPLFVYYHGGGFCLGELEVFDWFLKVPVLKMGFVVVSVGYRLAPENPFPTAPNDAWDALKWIAANAPSKLHAQPSKTFIIGGESAGANLTAVVAHLARDENLTPPLTGLLLSIPLVLPPSVVPAKYKDQYLSRDQCASFPVFNDQAIQYYMDHYKPDPTSPLFAPFNHPSGHADLPPTFFQVCGMDPFRDEGLIYEKVLREEYGVSTRLKVYAGVPHGVHVFFPELEVSRRFVREAVGGLGWLVRLGEGKGG